MLDLQTLKWVIEKDDELGHNIWDLREAIQAEGDKILNKEDEQKEISLHRS